MLGCVGAGGRGVMRTSAACCIVARCHVRGEKERGLGTDQKPLGLVLSVGENMR